jgi:hypothetical protein
MVYIIDASKLFNVYKDDNNNRNDHSKSKAIKLQGSYYLTSGTKQTFEHHITNFSLKPTPSITRPHLTQTTDNEVSAPSWSNFFLQTFLSCLGIIYGFTFNLWFNTFVSDVEYWISIFDPNSPDFLRLVSIILH